ncbi:MAG: hypothetical protein QM765_41305 [Myxococcales bacterium]
MTRKAKAPKVAQPSASPLPPAPPAPCPSPVPVAAAPAQPAPAPKPEPEPADDETMEARYWRKNGWSAKVIKNEDDDGWAVEICKDDLPEPVLISPWVMGRDKKNPKPFDATAFATFVKTASEVLDQSVRQREAALKKTLHLAWDGVWYKVELVLVPDEYEPYGTLTATTDAGEIVATARVEAHYKLTQDGAARWVRGGFAAP